MTSFRARLTARWTIAFGLLLALANVAIHFGSRALALRDLDAQVRTLAGTELASVVDEWRGPHVHEFPRELLGRGEWAGKVAQVVDAGGRVIAHSGEVSASVPLLEPDVLAGALRGESPMATAEIGPRRARVAGIGFDHEGTRHALLVGLFTDRLEASLVRLARLLAAVWLVGVALTAALGHALASRALAPVDRITARAASIAHGNLDVRLDPPGVDDEIGRMTTLLNEMLERLHSVIDANRRFAADASHELRRPLTAMAGELDVALKRARSADEYRETLVLVRARLDELIELADGLTVLVRAQEGTSPVHLREVALGPLVQAAVARHATTLAERRIALDVRPLDDLVAYADPGLLARAVENVVANAVLYDRDGGRVTIRADLEEAPEGTWQAGCVRLQVSDTGPGIPEGERERVFERFHRLDASRSRRTGGTGLGLSIARAALALCGAEIRVAASSSAGTVMEIRVPGARAAGRADVRSAS